MVSSTSDTVLQARSPAPLAWKEFRRRSGFATQPKVYVYDASPQIVPQSPPITSLNLTLSPIITSNVVVVGMESPRREHAGFFLSHVSQALQALGASTGGNIADYIANNFCTEMGLPYEKGRKLHYMVNAILSSPKYKYLFLKDQVLKDEKRSLWRLKKPGEMAEEDTTVPVEMSLSALIPPTSPFLSLKASTELEASTVPTGFSSCKLGNSSATVPTTPREGYGGSDELDLKKHIGLSRTTEHPPSLSSSSAGICPGSPSQSPPTPFEPSSPSDAPSLSLSSRRKKRKGLDSSLGIDGDSLKLDELVVEEKKRKLDVAAA